MTVFKLYIQDMKCIACATPVESALSGCPGVLSVSVNTTDKTATVTTSDGEDPDKIQKNLNNALEEIGFPATACTNMAPASTETPDTPGSTNQLQNTIQPDQAAKTIFRHWLKGFAGVIAGTLMMLFCMWGMGFVPLIGLWIISGMSALLTLYLGKDTYKKAVIHLIKAKTLSMEALFTVSTLLALGVSCASLFVPWLPMMFDAGLFILGFKNIGDALRESAKRRSVKMSFRDHAPKMIEMEECENQYQSVSIRDLVPGKIIIVRGGQTIPVNGKCLNKQVSLDTRFLTGTFSDDIHENDDVYAGSVVPKHIPFIRMRVTASESESALAKLDQDVENAESQKAPIEISTNKILRYFIRTVFGIAIVSSVIAGCFISPIAAIQCGISVLSAACPCTLGMIIPLVIRVAIFKSLQYGLHFNSGKSVQAAAEFDMLVTDLNGTLTTGIQKVVASTIPKDMLTVLHAIEKKVDHPFARAICTYAEKETKEDHDPVDVTLVSTIGPGVTATVGTETFHIGNATFMKSLGIVTSEQKEEENLTTPQHIIYFVRNSQIKGTLVLEDPLRSDANETIQEFRRLGKKIRLLTGATENTAKQYARQLGISPDEIVADCKPQTKKDQVLALSSEGYKVAVLGDGPNDAPAMAASHFSVAIKSTASNMATQQNAGATINDGSLWPIIHGCLIANQAKNIIKQNLTATVIYNVLAMVAFGGLLAAIGLAINPGIGALLMVAQVGLILINLERFKRQKIASASPLVMEVAPKPDAALIPRLLQAQTTGVTNQAACQTAPVPVTDQIRRYSVIDPPGLFSPQKSLIKVCVGDLVSNFRLGRRLI